VLEDDRSSSIPNLLPTRDPELARRLATFAAHVNAVLLDRFAAQMLGKRVLKTRQSPDSVEDVKAAALLLRMLTKADWDENDLEVFEACWHQASTTELFGEEFEAERHRIQHCMQEASEELSSRVNEVA
jgi:hypothetical protein